MTWQKRARIAVAVFGIAFAAVVFFAIGEREKPKAAPGPERLDPTAVAETSRGEMRRVTGTRQDFTVTFDRQLAYEDGASRLFDVRIEVKERRGRDFVITGAEAVANEKSREISLTRNVVLAASDGFELSTDTATFTESDGLVRTPGPVTFRKGRMSGGGVGMTYDKDADVLHIADQSRVRLVDETGRTVAAFTSGAATLARQDDYLALERSVHVVRDGQIIDADRATARLTENEEAVTYIELRGSSRVSGGSALFDRMSARDIDLDYTDDGLSIERLVLNGNGRIALTSGRQMAGDSLTLSFAADGALTSAAGRERVELSLPQGGGGPARQVRARTLDAAGEAGKGLTSARFADAVEFREEVSAGGAPRRVRAQALDVAFDGDAITSALFAGRVSFAERGLSASGAEIRYEPGAGILRVRGADQGGGPRVADERISIEADSIDVTLENRRMTAAGKVKTLLRASAETPALLKPDQPISVSAGRLEYRADPARAQYSGGSQLWQGETAIRAARITIDEQSGDLLASGRARSTLWIDETASTGRAEEIRYDNALRQIRYEGPEPPVGVVSSTPPPTGARRAAAAPADAEPAQLTGSQGDLRAGRIVVLLAKDESRMERLEAFSNISLRLDDRRATGARLTYHAADGRYVMSGAPAAPVNVVEPCRETTGKMLTFFKSTDRIIVDGNEEIRTRTKSGGPCPQAPPSR